MIGVVPSVPVLLQPCLNCTSESDACWRRPKPGRRGMAGGIAAGSGVSEATGLAASRIGRGLREREEATLLAPGRGRRPDGGCKPRTEPEPTLLADLLTLVKPDERGDPMS